MRLRGDVEERALDDALRDRADVVERVDDDERPDVDDALRDREEDVVRVSEVRDDDRCWRERRDGYVVPVTVLLPPEISNDQRCQVGTLSA